MTVGVPGWIRANLFSSPTDGILTIVLGAIIALAIFQSINWVFFTASWEAVTSRIPLYVIGRYPQDLYWRPLTTLLLISVLLGVAWRMWGGIARGFAIGLIIVTLLAGTLPYLGVDLGAPRYDATVEPDQASMNLRETRRDIADANRANAIDQKDITTLTGTTYLAGTLDGDEDRSDYYSFTITDAMKFKTILAHNKTPTPTSSSKTPTAPSSNPATTPARPTTPSPPPSMPAPTTSASTPNRPPKTHTSSHTASQTRLTSS